MIKRIFVDLINAIDKVLLKILFLWRSILGKNNYFICSFPKSGRTWVRFIFANYFNEKYGSESRVDLHNAYNFTPSLNNRSSILKASRIFKGKFDFLIFSTHMPYDEYTLHDKKVIFILRCVYDTIVSYYFHNSKHHSKFIGNIESFIRDDEKCLKKIVEYLNSWSPIVGKDHCLVVTYEALSVDTMSSMTRLIKFLNLHVDERVLKNAINNSSFESMKEIEIRRGISNHSHNTSQQDARRIRRGKVKGYVDYLSNDDIKFINNYLNKNDSKESLNMLKINDIEI